MPWLASKIEMMLKDIENETTVSGLGKGDSHKLGAVWGWRLRAERGEGIGCELGEMRVTRVSWYHPIMADGFK